MSPCFARPEIPSGTQLGRYRIGEKLGEGAVGVVYGAEDTHLGRRIAVKAVPAFGEDQARAWIRDLAREFEAADALRHDNLLRVWTPEIVAWANASWVLLPMERADESLGDWLSATAGDAERRLEEGLDLLCQAATGLAALHEAGLIHRDVKPANLLVVRDGERRQVKVADFGLAVGLARLAESRPDLLADGIGTPSYMAPEQIRAARWKDVTAAADVYALGMILYELIDGDLPYSGSAAAIRDKRLDRELPISRPEGPGHLAELALACLARDPGERPGVEELERRLVLVDPEEEKAFSAARKMGTSKAWREFVKGWPEGRRAEEARAALAAAEAEEEEERKRKEEQKRREEEEERRRKKAEQEHRAEEKKRQKEEEERQRREEEKKRRDEESRREEEQAGRKQEEERKERAAIKAGEVVVDPRTGLMWTQRAYGPFNWSGAQEYARRCRAGGYSDWRLPTIDELEELYEEGAGEWNTLLGITLNDWELWSGTQEVSSSVWYFSFREGYRSTADPVHAFIDRVLFVRRSETQDPSNLDMDEILMKVKGIFDL